MNRTIFLAGIAAIALGVSGCGGGRTSDEAAPVRSNEFKPASESSLWDLLRPPKNEDVGQVNRYIWNASLDVLSFLPIQSVDPFSGVIVTGYGTPPGGGRAYRATVYITDPALEARSLKVALATTRGPVAQGTQRAVEDAILARARQLRQADRKF